MKEISIGFNMTFAAQWDQEDIFSEARQAEDYVKEQLPDSIPVTLKNGIQIEMRLDEVDCFMFWPVNPGPDFIPMA